MPRSELGGPLGPVIQAAIGRAAGSGPCSVLYSGGLDSSLIAQVAGAADPTLVAVGVHGAHDLNAARSGAAHLGRRLIARELSRDDLRTALDRWAPALSGADSTARAVTIGLALALEAAPPGLVLCGQGADELFLGYAHFRGLSPTAAGIRRTADLERLRRSDWPRAERVARELDRALRAPFLDPAVVGSVLATDAAIHLPDAGGAKPVLRAIALELGVPSELANRPKKALQFGSGIARELARLDRDRPGSAGSTAR